MMLSKFIEKVEKIINENPSTKGKSLIVALKNMLDQKGDIEINLEHMCKHLDIKID